MELATINTLTFMKKYSFVLGKKMTFLLRNVDSPPVIDKFDLENHIISVTKKKRKPYYIDPRVRVFFQNNHKKQTKLTAT